MWEDSVGLHALNGRIGRELVVGEEQGAHEHEHRPYRNGEENTDESGLFRTLVVLGREVTLHDGLVCAVLLEGIEDTIECHHPERCLDKVPLEWAYAYLTRLVWAYHRRRVPCRRENV